MRETSNKASKKRPKKPVAVNRFHIDVRSDAFNVGDMEWAQILVALNLVLERRWPHVSAHLEENGCTP